MMADFMEQSPQLITREMKTAAHEIIYEAMVSTQSAFNASLVILEITHDDHAFDAADEAAEALSHLARAARRIYKMPTQREK
jgi:hypothetical protein